MLPFCSKIYQSAVVASKKAASVSIEPFLNSPRIFKQCLAITVDIGLCAFATWIAFYLRLGEFVSLQQTLITPALFSVLIAVPVFAVTGLYRMVFRFSGWPAIALISRSIAVYGLIYMNIVMIYGLESTPRTVGILQPLILFFLVIASRLSFRLWLYFAFPARSLESSLPRALIYGAGTDGREAASALNGGWEMRVEGFCDDNDRLHGGYIGQLPVIDPRNLGEFIQTRQITHVLLAMPSVSRSRRNQILGRLASEPVVVRTLPSMADLAEGRVTVSSIRELDVDDLLGRDVVAPNNSLLSHKIANKVICITGAGGSIGSELCRQVMKLGPKRIILIDHSEYSLYSIHHELTAHVANGADEHEIQITPVLGSVQSATLILNIMKKCRPDIVFHAAAYKHVTYVEQNVIEGIKNNVFGTLAVVEAVLEAAVPEFVLISTDKAVRPTNVMGATKRCAEMILQAYQAEENHQARLSMVRFGNVLASSGSVIPKFRKQIRAGGPVTVTHPEVTRFFMTIREASQLVIQASALAEGGDVLLLDMGEPVKIIDLARRIISLSGFTERSDRHPDGDIAIEITGLRPGKAL